MSELNSEQEQIYQKALALASEAERRAFVSGACGDNEPLRLAIEERLAAVGDGEASPMIGPYELLQEIGEGGFGKVYLAEQQEPVVRRVALKIIKEGMDTKQVVARFESERQALALMDHPNIAKVFDGGATGKGRPYFVMELVNGLPITTFCDENKYSTEQRLQLFVSVCDAVQHAHQKGIIHRDLKPSNVLITLHGDKAVPKVIDFGIAKATQHRLTDKTLFTQFQHFIGTPAYMSPEQASLSGLDVDTRSDVYGLGVLLYELLVGRTPFDAKCVMEKGLDEVRRVIREEEITRPSHLVITLEGKEQSETAECRGCDPRQLASRLRGELDWVLLKALEKDRTRRYESAGGLRADILSFLRDEPVSAVAPTFSYRFGKLLRKHWRGVAGAVALCCFLTVATGVSLLQTKRAVRAAGVASIANEDLSRQISLARKAESEANEAQARATEKVSLLAQQRGADLLTQGRVSPALANLAHSLRMDRSNRFAAGQLSLALMQGKVARRVFEDRPQPGQVSRVEYSADGRVLLTLAQKSILRWDSMTGESLGEACEHGRESRWFSVTRDGRRIVSSDEKSLYFWDLATGRLLGDPIAVDFANWDGWLSPKGNLVAVGVKPGKIRFYDSITLRQVGAELETGLVASGAFSSDGRLFTVARADGFKVWDVETRRPVSTWLKGREDYGRPWVEMAPSLDRVLLSGQGWAELWEYRTGRLVNEATVSDSRAGRARYHPSGAMICSREPDGSPNVWLWDSELEGPLGPPLRHADEVYRTQFSPNGTQLLTVSIDRRAYLWDVASRELVVEPFQSVGHTYTAAFSPDGTKVAMGGWYNSVASWYTSPPGLIGYDIPSSSPEISGNQVISPDGKWLLRHGNGMSELYELKTGVMRGNAPAFEHYQNSTTPFCADSRFVVLPQEDGSLVVHSVPSLEQIGVSLSHDDRISTFDVSREGRRIVTGDNHGTVKFWDLDKTERLRATATHSERVWRVRYGPTGKVVWSGSFDHTVVGWDAITGERVAGPFDFVEPLRRIVVGPGDERVYGETSLNRGVSMLVAWDVVSGQRLWRRPADEHYIRSLDVSPDGKWLITGAVDGGSHFLHADTGGIHGRELVHGSVNEFSRFSPDSTMAVTSGNDGVVRLWDVESTALIGVIRRYEGRVGRANFSPDGRFLLPSGEVEGGSVIEVPQIEGSVPETLLDLVEAYAGLRVNARGRLERVRVKEWDRLREGLAGVNDAGYFGRLQRWLVANPLERTVSPSASMSARTALERYLQTGDVAYLHRVLHLDPTSRAAMLALAGIYQQQAGGERWERFYRALAERR